MDSRKSTVGTLQNDGINLLARVMQQRMQAVGATPPMLDFGVINADMSLSLNCFGIPIPKTDYLVACHLTLGAEGSVLAQTTENGGHTHTGGEHTHSGGEHAQYTGSGNHSHSGGSHTHTIEDHKHQALVSAKLASLKAGDRVIAAWVGNDAVVLDIIVPATEVK